MKEKTHDWIPSLKEYVTVEIFRLCNIPFTQLTQPRILLRLPCPVNLNQARLKSLSNEFFVTHKYDGVRYLIVQVTFSSKLFLLTIDRRCQIQILESKESNNNTGISYVLDCELVTINDKQEYVAHDVLVFDSVPVLFRDFARRLKYIYKLRNNTLGLPSCKSFYQCADLKMLVDKAAENKSDNLPQCDGFIFIHTCSKFEAGTCESVYKWKDLQDISIDLFVNESSEVFMSRQGQHIPFTHSVVEYELPLVECCMHIVEFCYDGSAWFPALIRNDKNTANDIYVVNETIKSVRQPITLQDLVDQCSKIQS